MPSLFNQILHSFKQFPGVGQRMAERMVFHLLDMPKQDVSFMIKAINDFRTQIRHCNICGLISEYNPCRICTSSKRDKSTICVVKNVQDAFTLEKSGAYNGLYHILGGVLSPIDGVSEKDLSIENLLKRLKGIKELVFALEQNIESEATIKLICHYLEKNPLTTSRMAIGIPTGTGLEFVDEDTIKKSLLHRTQV